MRRSNSSFIEGSPRSLLSVLLLLACSIPMIAAAEARAEEINRVVLRVNDEILTLYDYEKRKAQEIDQILANPDMTSSQRQEFLGKAPKAVLFGVFRELLLESHANRSGVTVSEREVDEAIAALRQKQGIPDNETLRQALAASGMTYEELRDNYRQELLLSQVIRRDVTAKIEVSEDELRSYYRSNPEEFRVPEERRVEEIIVLEDGETSAEELQQKAQAFYDTVESGTPFEEVAAQYQADGASSGVIELGWLEKGDLGRDLDEAAWGLEVGKISAPVDGRGGFHILRLLETRGGDLLQFDQVENQIIARERNRRFGKQLNDFMAELSETSYIVEDIPPEAIGYRELADFSVTGDDELSEFRAPTLASAVTENADSATEDGVDAGVAESSSTDTEPSSADTETSSADSESSEGDADDNIDR